MTYSSVTFKENEAEWQDSGDGGGLVISSTGASANRAWWKNNPQSAVLCFLCYIPEARVHVCMEDD